MSTPISSFYEDNYTILTALVNEANRVVTCFVEETYRVIATGVDAMGRLFSQVDGLKAISGVGLTIIRFFEINSVACACFGPLSKTFKTIDELLAPRACILRLHEFVTGDAIWKFAKDNFPNLVRLASRLALFVPDLSQGFKFGEKMGIIAEETGNTLSLQLFGAEMAQVAPMFGYVGAALELAENIAITAEKGLNIDNGMAVAGSMAKMASIYVGGSTEYVPMLIGLIAKAVGSSVYFGKFIKTECLSN